MCLRGLGLLFAAWLMFQLWPVWLQRGPRTTVIDGPVFPHGTVDYVTALNDESSAAVTSENNAVVLLVQALGPAIFDDPGLAAAYYQKLGIDPLPVDGTYVQSLEQLHADDRPAVTRLWDELDQAMARPWSAAEYPDLDSWLTINTEPLKLCTAAIRRERYYDPLIRAPGGSIIEVMLPLPQACRNLTRLYGLRVMQHLHDGNLDAALADVETIHRLSRLVGQHPLMIPRLTATALAAMACTADGQIVQSPLLTVEQIRRHRTFLSELPPFAPMADLIDHGERFLTLDLVQMQFMGPRVSIGWLQPNAFLETFNQGYDEIVAAMREPDRASQKAALATFKQKWAELAKLRWTRRGDLLINPRRGIPVQMAQTFMSLLAVTHEQAAVSEHRLHIWNQLTQAGYALAEYRAVRGEFPESLEQLIPDFMDRVPQDLYGNGPFQYVGDPERNTILLYSVGENGVDDHGLMDGPTKADDIGFGAVPKLPE